MAVSTHRSSSGLLASWIPALKQQSRRIAASGTALLIFLLIWQLLCSAPDANLPSPTRILDEAWTVIIDPFFDNGGTDKGLFWHILASLQRVAIGFSMAVVLGVAGGILIGSSPILYDALDPIFQVLRMVPPLAWLPISLAALQDNQPAAIFVIFITSIWPIIINTAIGVQQIPQDYKNVSKVLQLNRIEYFTNVLLPATVPYVFAGLRIGVGLSWLAIVAAEMLIGGVGIGFFIWDSWNSSMLSDMIVALIWVGVVGLLLDRLVAYVGGLIVPAEQR